MYSPGARSRTRGDRGYQSELDAAERALDRRSTDSSRERTAESSHLNQKPELTAAIVCLLPESGRLDAEDAAPLFSLLAQLGGGVRAVVLVGGSEASAPDELIGATRVPRGRGSEAAALAAGVDAALERTRDAIGTIVLVTPELSDWSTDESAFADRSALAIVARMRGAAGWRTHLDEGAPLREGLLAVAADLWRRRARSFAAAETWHDLTGRIRDAGAPIFDFRALRRLVEVGLTAPAATEGLASGLTRALARLAGLGQEVDPRFKLDEKRLPWVARHGEPIPVEISGWVALLPQASELELRVGDQRHLIPVDISRPDVLLSFPDLADDRCGFRFAAKLPPLPPGVHEASLVLLPARAERALGAVRVAPRLGIVCDRIVTPRTFARESGLPLLVDGRVITTNPPVRIEAWLGERPLAVVVTPARATGPERPAEIAFRIGEVVHSSDGVWARRVRFRTFDARGRSATEERAIEATPGEPAGVQVEIEVGDRDPRTGRCAIRARGTHFAVPEGGSVALEIDGVGVAETPLVITKGPGLALGSFDLRIEPRLGLGAHEFAALLLGDGEPRLIERRAIAVVAAGPELRVERAGLERASGGARATLRIDGELRRANLVDAIRVSLDGRVLIDVDPRSFAVAGGAPEDERRRFQIAQELEPETGTRRLALELRRANETLDLWQGTVELPSATAAGLELVSADFDRLRRGSPALVWSSLVLDGRLRGAPDDAEVALRIDDAERERARTSADGGFRFVTRLEPGAHVAALDVVARGETLARLPSVELLVRPLVVPERWARDLDDLRAALGPAAARLEGLSSTELLRSVGEARLSDLPELTYAITAIAERARAARAKSAHVELDPARLDARDLERRLRVLFFSWEIPYSGHGGGVTMVNWLAHLGARHDITLVHPVHAGGEGLSEEVRGSVREILPIARDWHSPCEPTPFGVPPALLPTYTPALRGALAAELGAGQHDLANFEFAGGYLHFSRGLVPSLLVHHEVQSFALAAEPCAAFAHEAAAASWLADLVAALTFDVVRLPASVDALATLTEPEARFLAPFLPGATVRVNPIPIDLEAYDRRFAEMPDEGPPRFVFVGTYRHPPNRRAALRLIERIAPRLRERLPEAKLVLAGTGMPTELLAAARSAGVECPGFVADLAALYAGATATVAPIDSGGGMRVKLLEAMACRCPVITSALGMNGIEARAGEEYLLAESDGELVEAAVLLANNAALRRALAEKARAMLEREHSIRVQGERRERIWAATIAAGESSRR